jgi:hypothetical protein
MVSTSMLPLSVSPRAVKVTVAPLEPAVPQLLASLPCDGQQVCLAGVEVQRGAAEDDVGRGVGE